MSNEKFLENRDPWIKELVYDLQIKLFDEGFGKDDKFVQKSCWEEAVNRVKKLMNDDPNKFLNAEEKKNIKKELGL